MAATSGDTGGGVPAEADDTPNDDTPNVEAIATREHRRRIPAEIIVTLLVALGTFLCALGGGTFSVASRTTLALALWWTLGVAAALGVWSPQRLPRNAQVVGSLLAAFALWTGASALWA